MIGYHTIWDIYDCNADKLKYVDPIKIILNTVVNELRLGKVSESYKQFEPFGATGFILLEESHISIHTWPEHQFAAIDIFSCKPFEKEAIIELLSAYFETNSITSKIIERGLIPVKSE
ncbi:MAG TPA: adenosylmethionine decarboxylase [Flavobacterium sp.]|mgnify:CR=1 FL=1|uniref:adenosylmethionine decarboxylase n=1 Tax=unclassified Flavobacterium TaxID=196869 RepID=UPI0025C5267D|nr:MULTISPECIES: adenosylmethionine decarboxylase [unclassified Flavobacterium]HRE76635.1 adenosylmethionine decarboxylase [Flavobacterium sp.]